MSMSMCKAVTTTLYTDLHDYVCGRIHERQGHHRQLGDRGVRMMNAHNRRCSRAAAPAEICQSICLASSSAAAPPPLQSRSRVALVRRRTHDLEHARVASTHLEHVYREGTHCAR